MGKRRPKPVSILADAEWRSPLIETEGITGKTTIMSNHNFYPNTELGIDLKLMTKEPGRMAVGEYLDGAITHDGEDHFTFVQNDQEKKLQKVVQRNPHVYEGKYINVNRKKDGTLYPTFNRPQFSERFTFQDFCQGAADELRIISGKSDDRQTELRLSRGNGDFGEVGNRIIPTLISSSKQSHVSVSVRINVTIQLRTRFLSVYILLIIN